MTEIAVWSFAMGDESTCLEQAKTVRVPHTWGVDASTRGIQGKGWYKARIELDPAENQRTFLRFHGAYRDTRVWVNGFLAGEHTGSGYTPFELEITKYVDDPSVEIVVSVDNCSSSMALPVESSFDWPDDGGLIRPVVCYQTGDIRFREASVSGMPILSKMNSRNDSGSAFFYVHCDLDGDLSGTELFWALYAGAENSEQLTYAKPELEGILDRLQPETGFSRILADHARYWHFDKPDLYTLRLTLCKDGMFSDERWITFGFRQLRLYGSEWRLNGEPVRLPGMEWMPGSDPRFGLAEPSDVMETMLNRMKECNCVLTRFHWQQDERVLDYCDRHGLLVQEEVPFWGPKPENPEKLDELWPVLQDQLREMIMAHRSHPCIIAWGVGNGLAADAWPVQQIIRRAVGFVHDLDPSRQVNYVTNTAWGCPHTDGTVSGDVMMINDYIGTWHTGYEQMEAWKTLIRDNPGRIMIPSEFGLCEPAFPGGDEERTRIFLKKMACYRQFPQIAGTIFFSLNDYRTHMGEATEGSDRIRIHGITTLNGSRKPSFYTVQREYCPLTVRCTENALIMTCRSDIPSYTVKGYMVQTNDKVWRIPTLRPGASWILVGRFAGEDILICRPDGRVTLTV